MAAGKRRHRAQRRRCGGHPDRAAPLFRVRRRQRQRRRLRHGQGRRAVAIAARYSLDTFVIQLPSGANHLGQKGDLRDSAHAAVVGQPGKFTTTPPVAGKDIDALNAGRLAVYPAGTEL